MSVFFNNVTFADSFAKRIIEEPRLSIEFKKEFWKCCGHAVDIGGVEKLLAEFLVKNDCEFAEELLYKFTDIDLSPETKAALLAVAIRKDKIDLNENKEKFEKYFCAIGDEYADFAQCNKTIHLNPTQNNVDIANFMKNNVLFSWHRISNDKIILKRYR